MGSWTDVFDSRNLQTGQCLYLLNPKQHAVASVTQFSACAAVVFGIDHLAGLKSLKDDPKCPYDYGSV